MSYTTYEDLDNEISGLANLVPEDKDARGWVEYHIAKVQREINGRLAGLYSVPFADPAPDIVQTIALNFAAYSILRPNYVKEDPSVSDWVDAYRKQGEQMMKDLIDGTIVVADATSVDLPQSSTEDYARTFTEGKFNEDGERITSGSLDGI